MYFAVIGRDKSGQAELRSRLRPAHRAWLREPGEHRIVVRLGGPLLGADGEMNGTLLIVEARSEEAVLAFLAEDPYCRNQMFEHLEVRKWQWSLGQPVAEMVNSK
jgi:uncharacterized protein YciI